MTRRSRGGDPGSDKSPGGGRLDRNRSTRYTPGPADPEYANTRHKAGGNALGHCHRNPPKWDDRDAVCTWCVSVATLRHALGADRG